MTARPNYVDSISSDDSFDWSSDSAAKTKRKTTRKTKTKDSTKSKNATADGPIKKAKKPGRKPLAKVTVLPSDPKLKRKAQNRAAQRAFRERKEQFVSELQEQMKQLQDAKDKREKEFALENARLKKENERLKEENYILKDAKFTFEFPPGSDKSQPVSPPVADKGEDCCGLMNYRSPPFATFDSSLTNRTDNSDLFNGKSLTDYRVPASESDFLIQNEPLPQLFGNEMDLFGLDSPAPFNNSSLDPLFSDQMDDDKTLLKCAPENEKPCKKKILAVLDRAKGANRRMYEIHQDVKSYCPDFNLDQLCDDMKRKITFDSNHILTDADVDLYIECIQRTT